MKFVTFGSFIIQHEAENREQAESHAESFTSRMENGLSDRALVSDYLLQHQVRPAEPDTPLAGQLELFEEDPC